MDGRLDRRYSFGGLDMLFYVADDDTRIVPARGPVLTRADLRKQYEMYGVIWERLVKTLYGGGGPKEALAAKPTQEFDATMGRRTPSWSARSRVCGRICRPCLMPLVWTE